MGKASTSGKAKTRLVPPLTPDQAAALNTAFLQDALENVLQAGRLESISAYVAYSPPGSEEFFRGVLPGGIGLIDCSLPDFGECLFRAVSSVLQLGHTSAGLLNSDSPTLPPASLTEAARALARPGDRVVLGPSDDGGYYFIGVKGRHRRLFDDIAWSTENVCRQTCDRAAELGLEIVWLDPWYDVDDVAALERLSGELATANSCDATHTRAALQNILLKTPS